MKKISARNLLKGKVSAIFEGSVNNEVMIKLESGDEIVTVITKQSCTRLGITLDKSVVAIIKAPWIVLAEPDCGLLFSARNQFKGKIVDVQKGAVNSSVHFTTENGLHLTAIVTNESTEEMGLATEKDILGLVKASSIILAVEDHK